MDWTTLACIPLLFLCTSAPLVLLSWFNSPTGHVKRYVDRCMELTLCTSASNSNSKKVLEATPLPARLMMQRGGAKPC
jgi:hypothetical protein